MKKIILILLFGFACLPLFAQGEANNWYFGRRAGIRFMANGSVTVLTDGVINTSEGCSSISDSNGNLLLYTDGRNVWDRNHVLMPNGDYNAGTGLLGDPSSTQSGIIIPKKGDPNIYYVFTVDEPHQSNAAVYPSQFTGTYTEPGGAGGTVPDADDGYNNGLNYSVVDLSVIGANGSIGDVVTRNVHLQTYNPSIIAEASFKCSEKITALKNNDGTGFWVISHFIDKFYAFRVDGNGVDPTPTITQIVPVVPNAGYRRNSIGCIKASPDGKKLAIAHMQRTTIAGGTSSDGTVYLYDLDDATGVVSNPVQIADNISPYGVEFSPAVKKLYVSYDSASGSVVRQYDLLSADIPASGITIANTQQASTLQLGPNGKIYRARVSSNTLDVIHTPEETGALCDFEASGQPLGAGTSIFGLPPFITSLLSAKIQVTNSCLGQVT
ncbi:MAG: cell surface protein, partial [Flavobacterium sp.]